MLIKGQLISKWFLGVVDFPPKTNENKSTWGTIVVKSNLFVRFLEEIDDLKKHFEINWPLGIEIVFEPDFGFYLRAKSYLF